MKESKKEIKEKRKKKKKMKKEERKKKERKRELASKNKEQKGKLQFGIIAALWRFNIGNLQFHPNPIVSEDKKSFSTKNTLEKGKGKGTVKKEIGRR